MCTEPIDMRLGFDRLAAAVLPTELVGAHERRKAVQTPLAENLPRVHIELLPPEVEREGRGAFEQIGAEKREVVEPACALHGDRPRPASVAVVEVVCKTFVRKRKKSTLGTEVLIADSPELPSPRGLAGPGFLADTIVERWQDHLRLNREEAIYVREGIELDRSTLCTWPLELAELAEPLVAAMHADALEQRIPETHAVWHRHIVWRRALAGTPPGVESACYFPATHAP